MFSKIAQVLMAGLSQMHAPATDLGIIRITLISRSTYEWKMDRILDAVWLPKTIKPLIAAYESMGPDENEQFMTIGEDPVLYGIVIRGARPADTDRCGYFILWLSDTLKEKHSIQRREPIADFDVIGRLLLLLMQGGPTGIAAATSLSQLKESKLAAKSILARKEADFQSSALRIATSTENEFEALLIKACIRSALAGTLTSSAN